MPASWIAAFMRVPRRICFGIVVAPQAAVFDVDRLRQIGRQREEPIVGDIVHPLDDFRNGATRPGHLAWLSEESDRDLLLRAGEPILNGHALRLDGQIGHPQAIILEWVALEVEMNRRIVFYCFADFDQAVRQPIAQPVAIEQRHHHIHIGLVLDQPLARVGDWAIADPLELHSIVVLEGFRQRDEIVRVHFHPIGMALVADQLRAVADDLAIYCARPVAFHRLADHDHGPAILGIPLFHGLEGGDHLAVVVAVVDDENVPAVRGPLIDQVVAVVFRGRSHRRCSMSSMPALLSDSMTRRRLPTFMARAWVFSS